MAMDVRSNQPEGNAYSIINTVARFLKEVGRDDEIDSTIKNMKSGNYEHLCKVARDITNGVISVADKDGNEVGA